MPIDVRPVLPEPVCGRRGVIHNTRLGIVANESSAFGYFARGDIGVQSSWL